MRSIRQQLSAGKHILRLRYPATEDEEGKRATEEGMRSTGEGMRSTGEGMRSTVEGMRSTVEGMRSTVEGMRSTEEGMRSTEVYPLVLAVVADSVGDVEGVERVVSGFL